METGNTRRIAEATADGRATPEADGLQLSVAAVARKLGIAPAILRTWDRRYGIGPAEHLPGTLRRDSRKPPPRWLRCQRAFRQREDTPCGGRKRPLTAAGQQRWVQPRLVTKGAYGLLVDPVVMRRRGAPRRRRCG
jgi:hypothetical protein